MTTETVDLSQAAWQKSSYSGGTGGQCVEVAVNVPGVVAVRDSKDPSGAVLTFAGDSWRGFVRRVITVATEDVATR